MGNSETALKSTNLELDKLNCEVHDDWNVCPGKLGNTPVAVFSALHPTSSRKRMFMEKALQASKIYRHPGILRYMDGGIVEKEVVVVTESGSPVLLHGMNHMSPLQITAGLSSIIEALMFLHDKAGVSHNNVCASTIYITSDGSWKLWGLEYSCSFGELTRDYIEKINQYCNERCLPPDDKSRISPAYQHSRDCYSIGKFIVDTIAPLITIDIPFFDEFLQFIKTKALHKNCMERPRLSIFLEQPLFNHEFIQLRQSLNNILLLSTTERDDFIKSLPNVLKKYSEDSVAVTYAPIILSRSFMLISTASKHLVPYLLTPKCVEKDFGIFSPPVYKEIIVPILLNLFEERDAAIRKILLTYFHHYVQFISKEVLTKRILPQTLLGIRDTDETLVASTLECLACLVPVLGADIVVGSNREQIFASSKPKSEIYLKTSDLKRKKPKMEQKSILADVKGSAICDEKHEELNFPATLTSFEEIPERSSPDGGEVTDEDVFTGSKETLSEDDGDKKIETKGTSDETWSDWEEILDQPPPPEIVGILQVKTPEKKLESEKPSEEKPLESQGIKISNPPSSKVSAMQLKSAKENVSKKTVPSQGLGEEFDIMSLKIEKKRDAELDFFADLKPKLDTKNFDLESMLIDASHHNFHREKHPSLSDTLAELQIGGNTDEGDAWDDDEDQIFFLSGDETTKTEEIVPIVPPVNKILEKIETDLLSDWGGEEW